MNLLTQSLLKELLGEQKTVAIYGGGFKPPTKGHFLVVEKALQEFPEIDELKIFVGGGVRDGITQDKSIKIWEIYKPYLSDKIDIEASVAPVKSVLGYAKDHPEEKVYWILGAREGDEEDLKDIENRTKSLSKYPNIEVKIITTAGGVSGTKTRKAILDNNKELFLFLIPDVKEKEEIWNILTPVVKEEITNTEVICDNCGWEWPIDDGGDDLYICHKCGHDNTPKPLNEVGEANLEPYKWEETDREGYSIYTKFETDSSTIYSIDLEVTKYKNIPIFNIEFSAKPKGAEGSSSKIVVNKGEMYKVMSTITDIVKKYLKKFPKIKGISYYPSKKGNEDFGTQRDNLYKAFISKAIPGAKFEPIDNVLYGDGTVALMPNIKIEEKSNDPFGINAYARELVKETFKEDWNLKEGMLSLSKYMIDNGMNIKPLPKIKVIKDDEENASNLLGKTAYYNPVEKYITLYTMNRHPKDILRSFAHEMVHHMQNLEGRLNNIVTQNTNEDGDLPEIEREAYEKGNMMLRNWEDNIKNV